MPRRVLETRNDLSEAVAKDMSISMPPYNQQILKLFYGYGSYTMIYDFVLTCCTTGGQPMRGLSGFPAQPNQPSRNPITGASRLPGGKISKLVAQGCYKTG